MDCTNRAQPDDSIPAHMAIEFMNVFHSSMFGSCPASIRDGYFGIWTLTSRINNVRIFLRIANSPCEFSILLAFSKSQFSHDDFILQMMDSLCSGHVTLNTSSRICCRFSDARMCIRNGPSIPFSRHTSMPCRGIFCSSSHAMASAIFQSRGLGLNSLGFISIEGFLSSAREFWQACSPLRGISRIRSKSVGYDRVSCSSRVLLTPSQRARH